MNFVKWQLIAVFTLFLMYSYMLLNEKAFWGSYQESRRAQIASEFLEEGHSLLIPTLQGSPIITKPSLFYWLQAVCMKFFGQNETGARLPSVFFGIISILAVYLTGSRWRNKGTAIYSAAVLLSSFFFLSYIRIAELDMGLCSAIIVSSYCLYRAVFEKKYSHIWGFFFWVGLTIGFFIKGPYAVFPLVALSICLFIGNSKRFFKIIINPGIFFYFYLRFLLSLYYE
ncbi:MAG: glycosyltransferase family 39 protein [Verrucomicrobiota bacterium]|nr:glycosyltransferase family 39 protein [Verrucomicrobiota bacterium]